MQNPVPRFNQPVRVAARAAPDVGNDRWRSPERARDDLDGARRTQRARRQTRADLAPRLGRSTPASRCRRRPCSIVLDVPSRDPLIWVALGLGVPTHQDCDARPKAAPSGIPLVDAHYDTGLHHIDVGRRPGTPASGDPREGPARGSPPPPASSFTTSSSSSRVRTRTRPGTPTNWANFDAYQGDRLFSLGGFTRPGRQWPRTHVSGHWYGLVAHAVKPALLNR